MQISKTNLTERTGYYIDSKYAEVDVIQKTSTQKFTRTTQTANQKKAIKIYNKVSRGSYCPSSCLEDIGYQKDTVSKSISQYLFLHQRHSFLSVITANYHDYHKTFNMSGMIISKDYIPDIIIIIMSKGTPQEGKPSNRIEMSKLNNILTIPQQQKHVH